MRGLLDGFQSASNAVASNVSGPVDLLSWLLRKAGAPVGDAPMGSSAWMERHGLTRPVRQGAAQVAGETMGLLGPMAAVAKAPQIARGLLSLDDKAMDMARTGAEGYMRKSGLMPGMAPIPAARSSTDDAMKAAGFEGGWFRGGPGLVANKKSGDWYSRSPEEAADYGKRFGAAADVREYAIPSAGMLKSDRAYSARLAGDVASKLDALGPSGAKTAKLLREYYTENGPSGMEIWRSLSKSVGDDEAMRILSELGFKSVRGVNSPDYVRVFPQTAVRDAKKAKFDLAKLKVNDVLASVGGFGLLGGSLHSPADE